MNITEEDAFSRRQKMNDLEWKKDKAGLLYMLGDERGRWFLSRLMDACGEKEEFPEDVNKIFIAEGKRRIGLHIERCIRELACGQKEREESGEIDIVHARRMAEDEYEAWKRIRLGKGG